MDRRLFIGNYYNDLDLLFCLEECIIHNTEWYAIVAFNDYIHNFRKFDEKHLDLYVVLHYRPTNIPYPAVTSGM